MVVGFLAKSYAGAVEGLTKTTYGGYSTPHSVYCWVTGSGDDGGADGGKFFAEGDGDGSDDDIGEVDEDDNNVVDLENDPGLRGLVVVDV